MKVEIKYNPYLLSIFGREKDSTTILVDGKNPANNSSLIDINGKRLQEWCDRVPKNLYEEYKDTTIEVEFTGTKEDFDDLKSAFDTYKNENPKIEVNCTHSVQIDSADDVINKIQEIFNDIQESEYVPELQTDEIKRAFETALNMEFEVDVIATVSAGKSTLINALLGKKLMPMSNNPTTSNIVRIKTSETDDYSAEVFYKTAKSIKIQNVEYETMKELNENADVTEIDICGKIPFAQSSDGMKLVLVDTPGPNNAEKEDHERMTFEELDNSEKSLVLFVIDAAHNGIDDEKVLLEKVSKKMQEHGKQSRDRYIFAINQLDRFKVSEDGEDWIPNKLKKLRNDLDKKYQIKDPNLFPLSALTALELRTNDEDCDTKDGFRRKCEKLGDRVHFETYNKYSHLPDSIHKRIEEKRDSCENADDKLEIYSGIVSIEEAIKLYIDKYAKTIKVGELIRIFKPRIDDKQTIERLQQLRNNSSKNSKEYGKQIKKLKSVIKSGKLAKKLNSEIQNINVTNEVEKELNKFFIEVNSVINELIENRQGNNEKVIITVQQYQDLRKTAVGFIDKFVSIADSTINNTFNVFESKIINEYNNHLKKLSITIDSEEFMFSSYAFNKLTELKKEYEEENHHEKTIWDRIKDFFNKILNNGKKEVDTMDNVINLLQIIKENLLSERNNVVDYTGKRTEQIKQKLSTKINEVEKCLKNKMSELQKIQQKKTLTDAEAKRNKDALEWLKHIQDQIEEIL